MHILAADVQLASDLRGPVPARCEIEDRESFSVRRLMHTYRLPSA